MIEICIKTSSGKKLREDFILLKLAGRGSSGMSHMQLERTLGRAFLPSAEWGCHRAQGQGREKNALIHFLTRYAWEGSPQGCCGGGVVALFFQWLSSTAAALGSFKLPPRGLGCPPTRPQPAPKGADRPGAAEEVASGTSSQQAAKVWLGACQIRVDTNV